MRVQLGRESTVAVVQRLVAEWQEAGYFAEPLTVKRPREAFPGIDLISQVDESYGRDIGSEVPLCLLEDGHAVRSLSPEDWMAASDSLEVHGAVVLRELISTEQVMRLRERMHLQSSQLDLAKCKGGVPPIREFNSKPLQAEDEDLEPHMSTPGRKHFYLRGRIFEQQVAEAQAGAMPLVWEHLLKQGAPQGLKPYLSEVQLTLGSNTLHSIEFPIQPAHDSFVTCLFKLAGAI